MRLLECSGLYLTWASLRNAEAEAEQAMMFVPLAALREMSIDLAAELLEKGFGGKSKERELRWWYYLDFWRRVSS